MFCGILNVYKEAGFTSNDVVAKLRGILHQKKIGHSGTLDPDAEGTLPVLLGDATRLSDRMTDQSKTYQCVLLLGCRTDTQDISGTVLSRGDVNCSEDKVKDAVYSFQGDYEQTPPMYSAKKINGQKLYDLARKGITVERKSALVRINSISIDKIELPYLTMTVDCSKGTYIRTLCADIGEKLGCGGCMAKLKRTRAGGLYAEDGLRLSEIEKLAAAGTIGEKIIPAEEFFLHCLRVRTSQLGDKKLLNGNPLTPREIGIFRQNEELTPGIENASYLRLPGDFYPEQLRVCDSRGVFMAVYRYCEKDGLYRPDLMFLNSAAEDTSRKQIRSQDIYSEHMLHLPYSGSNDEKI